MKEILLCICQSQEKSEEIKQEIYKETQPNENIISLHDKNQNFSYEKAFINKKKEEKKIIFIIYIYIYKSFKNNDNIYIYQVIIIKAM